MLDPSPGPTLDDVMARFRRGAELVDAAVSATARLQQALETSVRSDDAAACDYRKLVALADVHGDNLLVGRVRGDHPPTVFVVTRAPGGAMRVEPFDVDRDAIAMTTPNGDGPLDRLAGATSGEYRTALQAVRLHVERTASSLSIAKTRLALQASFFASILSVEPKGRPAVFDLGLNQAAVRNLALAARQQLDQHAAPLATRNKRTLEALFATALTHEA